MRRVCVLGAALAVAGLSSPAVAQSDGSAAFIFAYRVKPGLEADFAAGYRRHLDWHAQQRDSLTWLGWTVLAGPGLGMFVDGVFGTSFEALDARVDPRGDAADVATNVTAFAEPVYRELYRLRRDLSSGTRLEAARPGPMQEVVRLILRPGSESAFEEALSRHPLREAGEPDYAVYERLAGGGEPGFLLVIQLRAFKDLNDAATDPSRALMRAAGSALAQIESEIWLYRPDLTYIPER